MVGTVIIKDLKGARGACDVTEAQRLEDRVELACMAGELLPREETSRAAFACRWCRAAEVCWASGGSSWA